MLQRLVPHMADYHKLGPVPHPLLGFSAPALVSTASVNTDAEGFRISHHRGTRVDTQSWQSMADGVLVVGGSFAFGVGATSDRCTLASTLAEIADVPHLNLGMRAAISTQELIAALPLIGRASRVVLVTGVNNLVSSLQSRRGRQMFGPMFFEEALATLTTVGLNDLADLVDDLDDGRSRRRRSVDERYPARVAGEVEDPEVASAGALRRQVRDLELLARICGPGRLELVIQPYADTRVKDPREEAIFQAADIILCPSGVSKDPWYVVKEHVLKTWPGYVLGLAGHARLLGVPVVDLNTCDFPGWSFVDRVHMTDAGYRQAAEAIVAGGGGTREQADG